jgi:hypothetical protein
MPQKYMLSEIIQNNGCYLQLMILAFKTEIKKYIKRKIGSTSTPIKNYDGKQPYLWPVVYV